MLLFRHGSTTLVAPAAETPRMSQDRFRFRLASLFLASSLVLCIALVAITARGDRPDAGAPAGPWRTPVAVAVSGDGRLAATANRARGTVSLVDLASGTLLDETAVGRRPMAIAAVGGDGFVAACESGDVVRLAVVDGRLVERARFPVGFEPHAVAVAPDATTVWVSRAASAEIVAVALAAGGDAGHAVSEPIAVGPLPRFLALSPDGGTLAVACAAGGEIDLIDTANRSVRSRHPFKGLNLGQPAFTPDGATLFFTFTYDGGGHPSPGNIRRGWVTGSRLGKLALSDGSLEGLTLDVSGKAVGDVLGLALVDGGATVLVSAGGTHEVLRLDVARGLPWTQISGAEVMDGRLAADQTRFRRLDLGGRPLGMAVVPTSGHLLVADALADEVHEIDPAGPDAVRSIALARGETPTDQERLVRRGEAIFHDARRSLDQWYSCHTCHWEGGGNTVTFDTLNDGSVATYKTVLPLWHLAETGPWTWHGWQEDLTAAVRKSMIDTMQAPEPDPADVEALRAFLAGLEAPPSPFRGPAGELGDAALRGQALFESSRAGCTQCHAGPLYTSSDLHDVGLGKASDRYPSFSVPTLVGGFRKTAWLHNARARSLEKLLAGPHSPEKVLGAEPLSEEEIADLVAFLRAL